VSNRLPDIAYGALAGLGLGVSGLLLYEYTSTAQICGPDGGCSAVRASSYASIAGVPTPLYGVVFFAVAAGLRLAGSRRALPVWLAGGALTGVALIGVQAFVVDTFCTYCLIVDLSAIALLVVWALAVRPQNAEAGKGLPATAAIAAILPFGIGFALADRPETAPVSGDLPAVIAAEQREGAVTVVEFLDFQCPHCRLLHGELKEAIDGFDDEVRVVRKNVPLPNHEHAIGAALAAICAEAQGRGDPLADAMLEADDLSPGNRELLADQAGVDMAAWRDCLESDFARKRLEADVETAESVGVRGLPTYFIGEQRFTGARRADQLREALAAPAR
jgi:protein-disulfide isomerase/uncharacterized membrane protein